MTGAEIAAVGAAAKPLVGPLIGQAVKLRNTPRRVFLKEVKEARNPSNPWLTRGESKAILRAYRDDEGFAADLLACTQDPSDALLSRLDTMLRSERRTRCVEMPYSDQLLDYADVMLRNFILAQPHPNRVIMEQARSIKSDTEELKSGQALILARVSTQASFTEADIQTEQDYRERLAHAMRDPGEQERVLLRGEIDGQKGVARDLLIEGLAESVTWAVIAPGGAGKTTELRALGRSLLLQGDEVIYLDLKGLTAEARSEASAGTLPIDGLLRTGSGSILIPTPLEVLMPLAAKSARRVFWILDGMNELPRDAANAILVLVRNQLRPSDSLLVSDRDSRPYEKGWRTLTLREIDPALAAEAVDGTFGAGAFAGLSEKGQQLLQLPFFLDLALRGPSLGEASTAAQAIRLFVDEVVGLDPGELLQTAEFAFGIYSRRGALSATPEEAAAVLTERSLARLLGSGTLMAAGTRLEFRHQLLLDYFAGAWLGTHQGLWTSASFDAISLEANSIDGLLFATEAQTSDVNTDHFLTLLHDWNWFATVRCLHSAQQQGIRLSREIALSLAAMLALKNFDSVLGSRARARRWTAKLDEVFGWQLGTVDGRAQLNEQVQVEVARIPGPDAWFETWWAAFSGSLDGLHLSLMLNNSNPLIGWAAANALRKVDLTPTEWEVLRVLYDAALREATTLGGTTRWRVVHALGWRNSPENHELLLRALDSDPYMWARHGAVRGLIECAASAVGPIRERLLGQLAERLDDLDGQPATQLFWAATRDNCKPGWPEAVLPLLRTAARKGPITERDARTKRLADFEEWARDGVTLPASTYRG
ncbi:MAG: hypothetical protein JWP14_400 [Frankiales bacterium]|nr:hypothetical protein [Frankiales bacterium]